MGNESGKQSVLMGSTEPVTNFGINIKQPDKLHLVRSCSWCRNGGIKKKPSCSKADEFSEKFQLGEGTFPHLNLYIWQILALLTDLSRHKIKHAKGCLNPCVTLVFPKLF